MVGICLLFELCKGTVSGPWKMVKFSLSCEVTFYRSWGNSKLYFDQPITKGWCQPIGGDVSYPTDSPTATRLGLCNSLSHSWLWLLHWAVHSPQISIFPAYQIQGFVTQLLPFHLTEKCNFSRFTAIVKLPRFDTMSHILSIGVVLLICLQYFTFLILIIYGLTKFKTCGFMIMPLIPCGRKSETCACLGFLYDDKLGRSDYLTWDNWGGLIIWFEVEHLACCMLRCHQAPHVRHTQRTMRSVLCAL